MSLTFNCINNKLCCCSILDCECCLCKWCAEQLNLERVSYIDNVGDSNIEEDDEKNSVGSSVIADRVYFL